MESAGAFSDQRMLDRDGRRDDPALFSARSRAGVVSAAHYRATEVGVEVLERGGNAIDAAVATSLALSVVESAGSGVGGMAYMLVHLADGARTVVLPGPCRAPRRATPEAVAAGPRYTGYRAIAVPTYVAVVQAALERYGTWSAEAVLAPAIELAEAGFRLTPGQHRLMKEYLKGQRRRSAARLFLTAEGKVPAAGTRLSQPVLGRTLRRLAKAGFRDFYEGEIAREIAADMAAHGGFVDAQDLAEVPGPLEEAPLVGLFGGQEVRTAGPPAGGRTLLEMLNLWDVLAPEGLDPDSAQAAALFAAVIRRARKDRTRYRLDRPTDPDRASRAYAEEVASEVAKQAGLGETSHLCVMDAAGNAVSMTQSIERSFGAKVVTESLGFLHNGYMKGFKIEAKRHPHYLRPGAVARSNAAPTMLVRGGRATVAIGSTGSERLLSGILQALVRLQTQTPFEAVHAPRMHVTPDRRVLIEADRFAPEVLARLERDGYTLERHEPYSFQFGGMHLAAVDAEGFIGVAEPRRDGAAGGPAAGACEGP